MFKLKQYKDAIDECDKLLKMYPSETQIHTLKGKIYYEIGNLEEAHRCFINAANFEKKDSQKIRELLDSLQNQELY